MQRRLFVVDQSQDYRAAVVETLLRCRREQDRCGQLVGQFSLFSQCGERRFQMDQIGRYTGDEEPQGGEYETEHRAVYI